MDDDPTDSLSQYRSRIGQRWREANQLCIELYLKAMEDADLGTVGAISGRFESIVAELESPVEAAGAPRRSGHGVDVI